MNQWKPYNHDMLFPGDRVKLNPTLFPKMRGREGIVTERKRVNFTVLFADRPYTVQPAVIAEYQRGNGVLPEAAAPVRAKISTDAAGLKDCQVGDVVLLYRGVYDVAEIVSLQPFRGKMIGGRSDGKVYRYQTQTFVQKLDKSKFSRE